MFASRDAKILPEMNRWIFSDSCADAKIAKIRSRIQLEIFEALFAAFVELEDHESS